MLTLYYLNFDQNKAIHFTPYFIYNQKPFSFCIVIVKDQYKFILECIIKTWICFSFSSPKLPLQILVQKIHVENVCEQACIFKT